MKKFILFLPFLSIFSAHHVSADKSDQWIAWSLCLKKGHIAGTREFNKCTKEQEERIKKEEGPYDNYTKQVDQQLKRGIKPHDFSMTAGSSGIEKP